MARIISANSMGIYLECPRKYFYRYNTRREAIESTEYSWTAPGKAFHAIVHKIKMGSSYEEGLLEGFKFYDYMTHSERLIVEQLVFGWLNVYKGDLWKASEEHFRRTFGTVEVQGYIDGYLEYAPGRYAIVDHKLTRANIAPGSNWWLKQLRTTQSSMYLTAYPEVDMFIVDAVRLPIMNPRKKSENPEFYKRSGPWGKAGDPKPGTILEDESIPAFVRRVRQHILDNIGEIFVRQRIYQTPLDKETFENEVGSVQRMILGGHFPRNPKACHGPRFSCEFNDVCNGSANINDPNLYQIRSYK